MTRALCAVLALASAGCTCDQAREPGASLPAAPVEEVTIEAGSAAGPLPVTMVLDPSGELCGLAVRSLAGKRHVLCDRTQEDLSAAALRRGLGRLKSQRPGDVVPEDAWLLAAPERAAVARSLAMRDPSFFSRLAVWVGESPVTVTLFGATFLGEVGGRGFRALVLLGPGAEAAESWTDLASRQQIRLTIQKGRTDPAVWPAVEEALSER